MADDVNHHSTVDRRPHRRPSGALIEPVADRRERARRSSYRLRFGIVYALLGVVVVGAIAAFAVLVIRRRAARGLRLVELAARGQRAREDAADRRPHPARRT